MVSNKKSKCNNIASGIIVSFCLSEKQINALLTFLAGGVLFSGGCAIGSNYNQNHNQNIANINVQQTPAISNISPSTPKPSGAGVLK